MPQQTTSEQIRLQELLRGLRGAPPGTAHGSMRPIAPLAVPPISTSIERTEGEPPTFLERTMKSLSPYFSAMDAKERTKVINKALDLDFKGDGSPLGVRGFSPAAETERREGLVSPAEGPPPSPPGALSAMFQKMRLHGIGQEPGSRGAGITNPGFLSRTMPSGIGLLDAPPPAGAPGSAPVPIDPSILARMQGLGRPGGPAPTEDPRLPGFGIPPGFGGTSAQGPKNIPMPPGTSLSSALSQAEALLGSEAFQGVPAPDFTSVEEKLEGLKPDAPLLQSFGEKLAGFLGGAASGARGARTLGEAILGAGGGAARAGAVSSREDQRRKERFEDLNARYAQAEINLEMAQVQADQDAKASNQMAVNQKAAAKMKLGTDLFKMQSPQLEFVPGGKGQYTIKHRDLKTGQMTVTVGNTAAPGDDISKLIQILRYLKLKQDVTKGSKEAQRQDYIRAGRLWKLVPGSIAAKTMDAISSQPEVQREGDLRAMHQYILQNPKVVGSDKLEIMGPAVMVGVNVYTPEQEAAIRDAYVGATRFNPEAIKQLEMQSIQQIFQYFSALDKAKKAEIK